ncbi:hypothetical protein CTI12_AA500160 [Artemisia annua]|uniref:Uncharacterized protein n=1 Tax=Artemisia annua TaxID=35608 RepID=A0A2U1LED0_ARTAN|nr:hypothetical protein CTI12_AA500160 [Artemisia annua]
MCVRKALYSNPENPQGPELLGEIKVGISSENVADETKESDCKGQTSFELIATEDVDDEIEEIKKSNTIFHQRSVLRVLKRSFESHGRNTNKNKKRYLIVGERDQTCC